MKKMWKKPEIKSELKIKQTLGLNGAGADGNPGQGMSATS